MQFAGFACYSLERRLPIAFLFSVLLMSATLRAATSPATEPSVQTLKEEEYTRQLSLNLTISNQIVKNLSDLITIRMHDGKIVFSTTARGEAVRIGLGNPLLLCTITQKSAGFVHVMLDDFTDPANVYMQADVYTWPGQLQIVGSWELADSDRIVTLQEKYESIDDEGRKDPGQIRLIVQETSDTGGQLTNFTLIAPDWSTLAREHPREIRQYVRPILHALHDESILQPDPHTEWQIFGAKAVVDPAAAADVRKIIRLLDSESYAERQSAYHQLLTLGTPGAIALMHLNVASLSPEQSARVNDVLLPYHQLSASEASALATQPEFLLDCMQSDDVQLRTLAAEQLGRVEKHAIVFSADASNSERERQLNNLRRALVPAP